LEPLRRGMGRQLKPAAAAETAEVESLDQAGRGVTHVDGKAVFVVGALPGESVEFRRTRRQRRHDEAVTLSVRRASPERTVPRCRHFGTCGGCSLQHLEHGAQLKAKGRIVAQALERIGGVEPVRWLPPLAGPRWGYRRRARLGCKFVDRKGKVLVGFREKSSPLLADLEVCEVLAPPAGELVAALAALVGSLDIKRRVPQIEVAAAENATALVLRVLEEPSPGDLARLRAFEASHDIAFYLQRGGLDTVEPLTPPAVPLRYGLESLPAGIEFGPTDFVQVNGELNRLLVARALELLDPRPGDRALDLFCGLGNFSLPLALKAASVDGVEGDAALVARARANAARNGIDNAAFHAADLAVAAPSGAWARAAYDLVLLDPPRAGAREVLPVVAAAQPRRVVYVSCHAGSFARDAGILFRQLGYRLVAAGIMDMFPHTSHVESIALFEPGP
jgi:23S rRNA (uracil1939-C5)-methyltransferase